MSEADVRPAAEPREPHEVRGAPVRRPHGAHPTPREYVRIAVVLFVITVMEVSTYYLQPPRSILVPVLFVFTFIKFSLVVLWFMHLRFDSRMYSRFFMMGIATAIT